MALLFEWDPRKASVNLAKHEVPFEEAMTVFADPLARIFDDLEHSLAERREIIVARLLVVCFVEIRERVRLISARKASRAERKDYEKHVTP